MASNKECKNEGNESQHIWKKWLSSVDECSLKCRGVAPMFVFAKLSDCNADHKCMCFCEGQSIKTGTCVTKDHFRRDLYRNV